MRHVAVVCLLLVAACAISACADDYPQPRRIYVVGPPPPLPGWRDHVRWCLDHHPGYDPRTNLFPDAYGYTHVCR